MESFKDFRRMNNEAYYTDIGHDTKDEPYMMVNNDIVTEEEFTKKNKEYQDTIETHGRQHGDLFHWYVLEHRPQRPQALGRIDHRQRKISMYTPSVQTDEEVVEYAKRLLEMDYPKYKVIITR